MGDEQRTYINKGVEEKKGHLLVTYQILDASGKEISLRKVEVSEREVLLVSEKEGNPPYPILKLPFKKGDSWTSPSDADLVHRYVGEEKLKVPAGEYQTLRVWSGDSRGQCLCEDWYAPGVGLVKSVALHRTIVELIAFTPGKG